MDSIYVDLLVPAARRLGEYWDDDRISFTDVTIGLGRLQQVVRALGWNTPSHGDNDHMPRSAFFAPGPGEQHTFGLFIVEDFFRRSGWRTWIETAPTPDELADTVRCHWFDVFGMSASGAGHLDQLAANIRRVRAASRNPDIFVLVGGRLFIDCPEMVARVGADATAATGGEAFLVANEALLIADNGLSRVASGS
jgi:methanogenic corrinoid protein MtbC1